MKRYAVIDTNVLVSAMLKWTSVPGNILEFAFSGTIIPVLNDEIVAEVLRYATAVFYRVARYAALGGIGFDVGIAVKCVDNDVGLLCLRKGKTHHGCP